MPRLARLRLVSVGHAEARFDDLILDFRNGEKRADNSVLWLRNGGGKSSILNLFFSLIRPNRREFLGATTGQKERRLEDYVLDCDRSLVIAEWELDGDLSSYNATEGPLRYLTGAFHERAGGSKMESAGLRTLFFSAKVTHEAPQLTLEKLPLYIEQNGERLRRRTITGFKQEWQDLGRRYPHADARETEHQWEWAEILGRAHIDPELFGYQVRMNRREGGAHELFRFQDSDQFVDLFLELVLESDISGQLAKNIEVFRDQLRHRANCLMPQLELARGLIKLLEPLVSLREERKSVQQSVAQAGVELRNLDLHLSRRIADLRAKVIEEDQRETRAREEAVQARDDASQCRHRAVSLRFLAVQMQMKQLREREEQLEGKVQETTRECVIWEAAIHLKDALASAEEAENCRKELERKRNEQAPLLADLKHSAATFASALRAAVDRLRGEETECLGEETAARQQANAIRERITEQSCIAAQLNQKATDLVRSIDEAARARSQLEKLGTIHSDESPKAAIERLNAQIAAGDTDQRSLESELQRLRSEQEGLQEDTHLVKQNQLEASHTAENCRERLEAALVERRELEQEPMLLRCLEVEEFNLENLDSAAEIRIRESAHAMQERTLSLRSLQAENQRAIIHLRENDLLPPEPDVEQIWRALRDKAIRAWSGWEYISTNVAAPEFREFIARAPEIARGVVVADADFERAESLLRSVDLSLALPVVVASQSSTKREASPQHLVIGPTSDAYFDTRAGKRELAEREYREKHYETLLTEVEMELSNLRTIQGSLASFRARYPRGWFDDQTAALRFAVERERACARRLAELAAEAMMVSENIAMMEQHRERLKEERATTQKHLIRVEGYIEAHGDGLLREQELQRIRADAASARERTEDLRAEVLIDERRAEEAARRARTAGGNAQVHEAELRTVKYIESILPVSTPGNIDVLRDRYHRLGDLYHERIGSEALNAKYETFKSSEQKARERLVNELRNGRFTSELKYVVDETIVHDALTTLQDPADIDRRRLEADLFRNRNIIALTSVREEKRHKAELCRQLDKECADQGGPLELSQDEVLPDDAERAERIAEAESRTAEGLERRATERERDAKEAAKRKEGAELQVERLGNSKELLETLRQSHSIILATVQYESVEGVEWITPKDSEVTTRVNHLREQLQSADRDNNRISNDREAAIRSTHSWIDDIRFKEVEAIFAYKLKAFDPDTLEREAESHREDLMLRVKTIEDEIDDGNKNRAVLISSVLGETDKGIRLLKSAGTRSKLPESLKALAGRSFLHISTHEPIITEDRQARIGELIDEIVRTGIVPKGIQLIQQAVRRLAKPINVRVLFPDLDNEPRYIPISDVAVLSGGERLTCAVLLYCTLAQLRASRHETNWHSSGTLLLDNPIGTASRQKFLAMQRDVAHAMGIQLIYTTALEDLEAIRMLPVMLRLRKGRYDRRHGHQLVELESSIEAARLVLPKESGEQSAINQTASSPPK
jgi:hypothetical protein